MNKVNYDRAMLMRLKDESKDAKLLLHACCAPCASYPVEELEGKLNLTLYFYNPNIETQEEYEKRERELKRYLIERDATLLTEMYDHYEFLGSVTGLESLPEGSERCKRCFYLRLKKTAEVARRKGFGMFSTTLTLSPLKNSQVINRIGEKVAQETGIEFLPSDFKKRGGYQRSIELSKEYNLYRQNYCGCEFSKRKEK